MSLTEFKKEYKKRGRKPKAETLLKNASTEIIIRRSSRKSGGKELNDTSSSIKSDISLDIDQESPLEESIPCSSNHQKRKLDTDETIVKKKRGRKKKIKIIENAEDASFELNTRNEDSEKTDNHKIDEENNQKCPTDNGEIAEDSLTKTRLIKLTPEDLTRKEETIIMDFNFDINDVGKKGRRPLEDDLKRKKPRNVHNSSIVWYEMPDSNEEAVKCMVCKTYVVKIRWAYHNLSLHNNLAWREGEEPVDFNDRVQVLALWSAMIKRKLPLRCSNCGIKKLSTLGFFSHIKLCGKNELEIENQKADCPICHSRMLATSVKSHIQIVHKTSTSKKKSKPELILQPSERRVAAAKAIDKFKDIEKRDIPLTTEMFSIKPRTSNITQYLQSLWKKVLDENQGILCVFPDCSFQTNDYETMVEHYEKCSLAPEFMYECKQCIFQTFSENQIKEHYFDEHIDDIKQRKRNKDILWNTELEHVNDDLFWGNAYAPIRRESNYTYKSTFCFLKKMYVSRTSPKYFLESLVTKFQNENYSKNSFSDYNVRLCDWIETCESKYFPSLNSSICVSHLNATKDEFNYFKQEHKWKTYSLFESSVNGDNVTTFCGGPITSMAWVPQELSKNQYIAVSIKLNPDDFHEAGRSFVKPGLIQIWDCGKLEKNNLEPTKFNFGIAHDYGIAWHMEWCPSGCYQENERLGLLAAACSSGDIVIFSVPFLNHLKNTEKKIYTSKPAIKLMLQHDNSYLFGSKTYQATKIVWTQVSGHSIIIGGFSNGMVSFWNLKSTSPLLRKKENDIDIFYPYISFHAHSTLISALSVANFHGVRWLFTSTPERDCRIWDLEDLKYPIMETKRGAVSDGLWMPFWNCFITSFDDINFTGNISTSITSIRDFSFKCIAPFKTKSSIRSIHSSWRLNTFAQSSISGELQIKLMKQLFLGIDNDKSINRFSFLISLVDWYDRTKDVGTFIKLREEIARENSEQYLDSLNDSNIDLTNIVLNTKHEILPTNYQDSIEKMGLIMCDTPLKSIHKFPSEFRDIKQEKECLRTFPAYMYPITSINKVCWNPNKESSHCLASGYQAGFLRIHAIHFLQM